MKKFSGVIILTGLAFVILFYITRKPRRESINSDFTRNYSRIVISEDTIISMPYNIDILENWKGNIVYHSMSAKILGLLKPNGEIIKSLPFVPSTKMSTIHSISATPEKIFCFDLNGRAVITTDFKSDLRFKDSLPKETRGAVVNNKNGYTYMFFHKDSSRIMFHDSVAGAPSNTIYALNKMYDQGFSHWGQLIKTADFSSLYYIPFYNSRIMQYKYATGQLTVIETLEKAPVKNLSIEVGAGKMLSSKTPLINRRATANSSWLFVLSYARGKEDQQTNEIVDLYGVDSGKYMGSINLVDLQKGAISGITCFSDKLLVSYKNNIFIYSIHESK
jgi:hypothetical protein